MEKLNIYYLWVWWLFLISSARLLTVENNAWKPLESYISGARSCFLISYYSFFYSFLYCHRFPTRLSVRRALAGRAAPTAWCALSTAAAPGAPRGSAGMLGHLRAPVSVPHMEQLSGALLCSLANSSVVSGIALQAPLLRMCSFQPNTTTCKFVLVLAFSSPIIQIQLAFLWSSFPHVKC